MSLGGVKILIGGMGITIFELVHTNTERLQMVYGMEVDHKTIKTQITTTVLTG